MSTTCCTGRLFEYAVLQHYRNEDNEIVDTALLVDPTPIVAKDAQNARVRAARAIPDSVDNADLGDTVILVRPFA